MPYVYILQGNNRRYYIGSTNNLSRRLKEHRQGKSKYTKLVLPVVLVFSQEYSDLKTARRIEYWLKKQKSALLIERIIKEGKITKNIT